VLIVAAVTYGLYAPLLLFARLDRRKNLGVKMPKHLFTEMICSSTSFCIRWCLTKQRKLLVAGIASVGCWLKQRHFRDTWRSKVICRAQHYQHNKRTQIFCYVVLLLYYRFKFLKNITQKSVWLMPDENDQ